MKLAAIGMATTALVAATSARITVKPPMVPRTSSDGSTSDGNDDASGAGTVRPPPEEGSSDNEPIAPTSPLDSLKRKTYKNQWHMDAVRVIHARVQSDQPALIDGRFVSSFGNGDLAKGYLSAMDGVNTASVEGALMYVQAEGINVNGRAKEERCTRKNNMRNIVFYEMVIVQTNETIAQFGNTWKQERDTFEYGPMVPMDGGKCTPTATTSKNETLPKPCLQYNGDAGEANLGPFVGGSIKDDDVRAPYPNTYWFSFPNTCPSKTWAKKTDTCRKATRKGLCDLGVAPDGVQCTFAYDILGWVPIDDVVGITRITNKVTGEKYSNFSEWCEASPKNNEFVGDIKTGERKSGLGFWKNPLDASANEARGQTVVELYNQLVSGDFVSTQIDSTLVKSFKKLPELETMRRANPPCYKNVKVCNAVYGCRREGYAQLCQACKKEASDCKVEGAFTFPSLAKAKRNKGDELVDIVSDTGSGSSSDDDSGTGSSGSEDTSITSPEIPEQSEVSNKTKAPPPSAATRPSGAFAASAVALMAATMWTA